MSNQSYKNFEEFFKKATGYKPYPYQIELAKLPIPSIIDVPTGAGKTATAVLALWLYRRLNDDENTPRRLVYCLPMRVLVEQTVEKTQEWLKNLGLEKKINIALLMGGYNPSKLNNDNPPHDLKELVKHPEKDYIIIGTQDILVSSALNRAYGNSPFSWPQIYGILNNDCMWIMDEVQIMENALPTSLQLYAFRNHFGVFGQHQTVWMSATINKDWLQTVDSPNDLELYKLEDKGCNEELIRRNNASKILHKAEDMPKNGYDEKYVEYLLTLHKPNTTTIILVNTVKRAQKLYKILIEKTNRNCKLIHSRFRQAERQELNKWIHNMSIDADQIIVATQVLEAGVDISSHTMITELSPWSNMVQRFGRCNRDGRLTKSDIYWIDIPSDGHLPYEIDEMDVARDKLIRLKGKSVSPNDLPKVTERKPFDVVLRKQDLINFFDTTADLSGNYTDASKFVRTTNQSLNVNIFWRDMTTEISKSKTNKIKPEKDEICSIPIYELKNFLKNRKTFGYCWSYVEGEYEKVFESDVFAGQTIMLNSDIGGYSKEFGWDSELKESVEIIKNQENEYDSYDDDKESSLSKPVTLNDHTNHVLSEITNILKHIKFLDKNIKNALCDAARYHDVGKTHEIFQETMKKGIIDDKIKKDDIVWAKNQRTIKHRIPGFRHEVASALAYLEQGIHKDEKLINLVSYLIMSHHGKVRLALRSISKKARTTENAQFLLGLKTGDMLPEFSSENVSIKKMQLNLSLANIGGIDSENPSWIERATTLRDEYGPFRLAYLEALIRAADQLASQKETDKQYE